ncbi:hypothetical protein L3X38_042624 [Prunus dulcis]|uniref:Uncharacterized protein n=1 Tax=Prunus dulcis TaxID=3755 RepID=A0AAD4YM54_PRUDU|nr:hypothetical protein L3X38_042624 [Prunus dulcis]
MPSLCNINAPSSTLRQAAGNISTIKGPEVPIKKWLNVPDPEPEVSDGKLIKAGICYRGHIWEQLSIMGPGYQDPSTCQ